MSEILANKLSPSTGTTVTLGDSGDTFNIPSGVTLTNNGTLNASAITAGTLPIARGGTGSASTTFVNLATNVTGSLPVANLNGGTSASSSTFWRGDGAWATPTDLSGLTGADQWRTNSNVSGDVDPITNVERVDNGGFGGIGSAMTQSSGVFTFPATGIWLIRFDALFVGNVDSRFNNAIIYYTTNDSSSYVEAAYNSGLIQQTNGSSAYCFSSQAFMFGVASTSTHKVKFVISVDNNATTLQGQTGANNTTFTFLRLGDI